MTSGTAVNLLASTILLASVYSLVNVGLVVLYRATGVLNFAQGQFVMLGAYLMTAITTGVGYWGGLVGVTIAMAMVGWLSYHLLIRFLLGADEFPKVVLSFMLAIIVTQGVVLFFGTQTRDLQPPTERVFSVADGSVPAYVLIAAAASVTVVCALLAFVMRTIAGLRMRALAMNETLASYNGVKVHRLAGLAWALAGAAAGIAGVMYGQVTSVTLTLADILLLAFPAAVLGGLLSIGGSILGSFVVAAVLTVSGFYLGGEWSNLIVYSLLLVLLMLRPYGLFGSRVAQRI